MSDEIRSEETDLIVRWIIENVTAADVPPDEGNEAALIYNLAQLAMNGRPYEAYSYKEEQDKFLIAHGVDFEGTPPGYYDPDSKNYRRLY